MTINKMLCNSKAVTSKAKKKIMFVIVLCMLFFQLTGQYHEPIGIWEGAMGPLHAVVRVSLTVWNLEAPGFTDSGTYEMDGNFGLFYSDMLGGELIGTGLLIDANTLQLNLNETSIAPGIHTLIRVQPSFMIHPQTLDFTAVFGDIAVGATSPFCTFQITNTGPGILVVSSIKIIDQDQYEFILNLDPEDVFPWIINSESTREFSVAFSPSSEGLKQTSINISHNSNDSPSIVQISGNATVSDNNHNDFFAITVQSENYPNPFNPNTTIGFTLPEPTNVQINIYNTRSQKIKTLVNEHYVQGYHRVAWDGTNEQGQFVSSGVYFYRLQTEKEHLIKRMLLLK